MVIVSLTVDFGVDELAGHSRPEEMCVYLQDSG